MSTPNAPVITKVWDADYSVVLKITGQYNSAQTAANTLLLQANTVAGANASQTCVVDVMGAQFVCGTANGWVSVEYSNPNGNVTCFTIGKRVAGDIGSSGNPLVANAAALANVKGGDLNFFTSALDANDSYTLIVTVRKNNFNGAFANVAAPYNYTNP